MHIRLPRLLIALLVGAMPAVAADAKKPAKGDKAAGEAHMKEELGVNQFTTPGIDVILAALRDLRPLPYDSVSRDIPETTPPDRAHLALSTGGIIADGFLAVVAEKQSRIEIAGRELLRHGKALGVGTHVTKHARSILESAARKDWQGVETELVGAQRDVEQGMMALRDEEVAHLVALGGWWRGLEITSTIVASGYSEDRAALLTQPGMLDYFSDRVSTLNPSIKSKPLFVLIETNLAEAKKLATKQGGMKTEDVKKLRDLAKAVNDAIRKPGE